METVFSFIAANLPAVLCLLVGVALVTVEVFLPGFGLPGISGLMLLAAAVVLTWLSFGALAGLLMLLVMLVLCGITLSVSIRSAMHGRLSRSPLILSDDEENDKKPDETLIGREGVTATLLRPAGIAVFDGVRLSVVTRGDFIEKDVPVRIVKEDGTQIVVETIRSNEEV